MFDFLNEFFKSELAQNNCISILVMIFGSFFLGGFLTWLFMKFVYMKILENKRHSLEVKNAKLQSCLSDLNDKYEKLETRHSKLLESSKKLDFIDDLNVANSVDDADPALDSFTK